MVQNSFRVAILVVFVLGFTSSSCQPAETAAPPLDEKAQALFAHVKTLAADEMQGRKAGTEGNARARAYLIRQFKALELLPLFPDYQQPFRYAVPEENRSDQTGINVAGWIRGKSWPDKYIVVTAHYDHLGVRKGKIYNGADDNASGVATLLMIAAALREDPPQHSFIFVALDAEEDRLKGAFAFVEDSPIPFEDMLLNINLDMLSISARNTLFACGTYHYPELKALLKPVAGNSKIKLAMGHDLPASGSDDWTNASDHAAFHKNGVPFLYFGVEDHAHYHKPDDIWENVHQAFFAAAAQAVLQVCKQADRQLKGDRLTEEKAGTQDIK